MKQSIFFFFLLALTPFFLAQAQETDANFPPPENPPEVRAIKSSTPIKVDGKLDEASWQLAPWVTDFFRREPRQGGPIKYATKVRVLYDDKYLYIGAFCQDTLGAAGIRVQDLRRDFEWGENDIFGVSLDPQNLKQYAQAFQTTPYGNQRDFQNFNGNNFDSGWNTLWKVRSSRTENGYYTEFAIPFKSLRYNMPKDGELLEWGITFVRYARRDIEVSTFPAIPQSFTPYRMTYAAKLTGIEAPLPSANLRVEPYSLYQYEKVNDEGNESSEGTFKLGGDIKWAINPKSVLDVTFNTDFAQADLDRAVNNLERFNIFFPEQRQFFLENSGIWSGSSQRAIRPFFSRRIGLQGEFNAQTAPIEIGARFTQRTEKETFAGLLVRQGNTDNSATANFGVLRYLKNYGRENNIGVMVTHRLDEANESLGLASNKNTTITVDGQIRPSSEWDIQYLASASIDETTGNTGFAGRAFAGKRTNKYYFGWLTEYIDDQYDTKMGFIRQSNLVSHNPGGYFILRPKGDFIRRWDPGMFVTYNHDATQLSGFQQASLYIFPVFLWFKDNSFLEMSVIPTWQNINFNFAPLGIEIALDDYFYTRNVIKFNTDQSKKWSFSTGYNWGEFYSGKRQTLNSGVRVAPNPHVAFTFNYEYNRLRGLGNNDENLETHLSTMGARVAANPRLQLSTFYQYNTFDEQGRWNVRFSWEYQPLSFLYLVFNSNTIDTLERDLQQQQTIAKITFLKQF